MKNRIKHLFVTFFCIAALVLLADINPAEAQYRNDPDWGRQGPPTQPMGNPGPPQLPDKPQQTPIGGGLALLLAAGGAYAVKKLKQNPA